MEVLETMAAATRLWERRRGAGIVGAATEGARGAARGSEAWGA